MSLKANDCPYCGVMSIQTLGGHPNVKHVLCAEERRVLDAAYRRGEIQTVFDIGANKGEWSQERQQHFPNARFVLFEANPLHRPELEASGLEFYISALTRPGITEVEFFSRDDDAGSQGGSIYKETTAHYDAIEAVRLPATTLDAVAADHALPMPDFVKLDVQGAELDIIAGGQQVLRGARFVLMEMPLMEYNRGAPSISEYLVCMSDLGFAPITVSELHYNSRGVIIQMDFLFQAHR